MYSPSGGNKSNALINQGKIQEALHIKEAAAEGFRTMGFPQYAAQVVGLCIKWYAQNKDFEKAQAAIKEYEALSGYFTENGDAKPGKEGYYHIKGTYFLEEGEMDSAEHYFRKLLHSSTSRNDQYLAAWGMTQLYYHKDQLDSIGKYALLTFLHSDTLYNIGAAENLQNAQAQYNYTRHLETAHRKELEAKESQVRLYRWIAGSITAAVIFAILILLLRKQVRKKGEELTVANKENAQLYTQIKENSKLIFGLNEQLRKKDADIKTLVLLKDSTEQLARQLEMEIRKRDSVKAKGKAEDTRIVKLFAQMAESRTEMPDRKSVV